MSSRKARRVPLHSWWGILTHIREDFDRDQVALVAGGVAFYWLLAMFPALATLVSVWAVFASPAAITAAIETYGALAPPEIVELVNNRVLVLGEEHTDTLTFSAVVWFLTSVWVALAGIRGIVSGINVAWDLEENRSMVSSTLVAFALLALGLGVMLLAAFFFAALPIIRQASGFEETLEQLLWFIRWPVLAVVMMGYLSVMYRVAPCRKAPPRAIITPGSVLATTVFLVASAGFSVYAQTFASYNVTYGSLSNGVVLLLWFWLSAIAVLIGAEMDAEIERVLHHDNKVQPARDPKEGPASG